MMNLVSKKTRGLAEPLEFFRFLDDLFKIFYAGGNRRELNKHRRGGARQNLRQSGFAASRRPPKDERSQFAGINHFMQNFSRAEEMLLADEFLQVPGPHPIGQRLHG